MNVYDRYYSEVRSQLERLYTTQRPAIEKAASWLGETLANDGWLYAFGTGHSHMLAEEIFYRAGGLAHAAPMLDSALMLHENAIEATYVERREGYAASLLEKYPVAAGDVLIVASNSGRNAVPVEMALAGRAKGMKVVVVVSLAHSRDWPSRHSSGKKLADVGDVVIDNCAASGDACLDLPGMPARIGPTSSITGTFIINALIVRGIELALAHGRAPEIFISSNSNGDDHNDLLLQKYKSRVRHL
ncbi:MAG TPA: SIS domain-containing protein [Methylomirabilota bacterium]|nr:SIS domain-containing protein [Methylomirabilota bacterium]